MKPFLLSIAALGVFISSGYSQTPKYSIGSGEYQNFILDNTTHILYGLGTAGNGIGSNPGQFGYPIPCQFPSPNTQIKFVAAGLHTGACVDMNGNVYFTGGNEDGTMGNGTTGGSSKGFVQITTDSLGNAFTGVNYLAMGSAIFSGGQGYGACIMAVKDDGTLWVWGNTQGGYRGNGTYGQVNTRPVQVPFPAGTKITKVFIQNIAIALDANGNVWTWAGNGGYSCLLGDNTRTNYMTPQKVNLPGPAKDIAGGGMWSYALLQNGNLYGWGLYEGYLGVGSAASSLWTNMSGPVLLDGQLNLPAPISKISCNKTSTYVILTDGTLWAWGGNECGQIGNGQEINWAAYTVNPAPSGGTPSPYAWDWGMSPAEFQQHKPVQIAQGINNFVGLSEGEETVFYKFAVDANGQLYSWGRNKTGILANGVMDGDYQNGLIAATYPNSFDVPYITAINPFTPGAKTILSTSPYCLSNPGATGCSIYPIPANTPPKSNAGPDQTVTTSVANLDGSASTDNVAITYYIWSQVSGPSNALIVIPSGAKAQARNLVNGVYKFQLKVIDNGWLKDSSIVTITVNSTGSQPPVANAGSNQTITLPTNSVTLTGTGSEVGGSIASFKWTELSGPNTATLGSSTSATTTAGNLAQGTYTFQLTVTDLLGITASATVTVTVNPSAVVPGPPSANAGSNQTITLPTNTANLSGSGYETNGTIVSYHWGQLSGPSTATIANAAQASTAVSGLVQGTYTFQLTVTDNSGKTAGATVTVTVNAASVVPGPPAAIAGPNQTITLPTNSVTLSGSGYETNGTIVSYHWGQLSGPSTATIANAAQASTGVSGLVQGTYTFQLTVTDNSGITAGATMTVTVNPVPPGAPTANAGSNQTITLPTNSVTLTGSGSETNGTIVSYAWTQASGPSAATISSPSQASTGVSGLAQGTYTFKLTVTDNSGKTGSATMTVTVNPAPVVPGTPQVSAGGNQTIALPSNSQWLWGNASETNGTIVSYQWTQLSGPTTAKLITPTAASTIATSLVEGTYTFQLTVTDNSGKTASATATVTVNPAPVVSGGTPQVSAGAGQTITLPASSASLYGNASETNGTIVSYQWTQVSGPSTATLYSAAQSSTYIDGLTQAGTYTFQLTVTDNSGQTASATTTVTVVAGNQSPVAIAGANRTVTQSTSPVSLNGSASYDPDGSIVGYSWVQAAGAGGVTIANSTTSTPSIYGMQVGSYTFRLTVTDNLGATGSSNVTITVVAGGSQTLTANAGVTDTVTLPVDTATLNGLGSTTTSGTIVGYAWQQLNGPSTAAIGNPSASVTPVSGLQAGAYTFQLTVTDNTGNTATATVNVIVLNSNLRTARTSVVRLWPNPVQSMLNVWYESSAHNEFTISVFNTSGVNMMTTAYDNQAGQMSIQINVGQLARGVYFLVLKDASGDKVVRKFVKQ
ncbi:MAG TPA: PKD domain-containing protein [Puia sp.]|nr:PKD domain-containing protein [Puia sp.]